MGLAINQAIIGMAADPSDVKASCLTSNCTFGSYPTMGVCSRVDDVTPDIVRKCPRGNLDGWSPGCIYTVKELKAHPPWLLSNLTTDLGGDSPANSLWIGASNIIRNDNPPEENDYTFPNPNTLIEFYTIYISDTKVFSTDSDANFSDSVVALKGGLDLCVDQYNTTVVNGTTMTVKLNQLTDLKWVTTQKIVGTNSFDVVSCNTGSAEYWMDENTLATFNHYLGLETFRGSSSYALNVINSGDGSETVESDAAQTFAGLLVNQARDVGQDGLQRMLDNLATSMTNS